MKIFRKTVVFGMLLCGSLPLAGAACAMDSRRDMVSDTVVINAPASQVWDAIKTARAGDPRHRRIVSNQGPDYVIEETFTKIPALGNVNCRYAEHEIADKKLEYQMISSDKFVAFNGVWELSPIDTGRQTALKLSSFVDTGLHLPFADKITKDNTLRSVDLRLSEVKDVLARSAQTH
ncbi:MAG: SRPBCC family protein [Cyanobacteria bacterium REEB67]|nr:SRPBCC family protein [Cyanobacteria bacterium REEB67]